MPVGSTYPIKSSHGIYEMFKETQGPITMALFNVGVPGIFRNKSFSLLLCDVISARNLLHVVTQNLGWPTSYLLLIDHV